MDKRLVQHIADHQQQQVVHGAQTGAADAVAHVRGEYVALAVGAGAPQPLDVGRDR